MGYSQPYHDAFEMAKMCKALGFEAPPWEIAEVDEYWQNAILVEYAVHNDPDVQASIEKQHKKAEAERKLAADRKKQGQREREKSRERAGENHLASAPATTGRRRSRGE